MSSEAWGLYIHVPWCRSQCTYCGFYFEVDRPREEALVDALAAERLAREVFVGAPSTVYLGGGTPSLLGTETLRRIIEATPVADGGEVTVEANPEDLDARWLDAVQRLGINRISLGVQTWNIQQARLLGRAHTVEHISRATTLLAGSSLASWSVDLIFAVPGQDMEALEEDLEQILRAGAPHVSLYGLTWEPDTPLERLRRRGRVRPVDDELWRAMYDRIVERFCGAGLARYEVSNFARPGHRAVHNAGYWSGRPYLGLGPSAHSLAPDGTRWFNGSDLERWLLDPVGTRTVEHPAPRQTAIDRLISGLRSVEGVDLPSLAERTGLGPNPRVVAQLQRQGLLVVEGSRIMLTDAGFPLADGVTATLVRRLTATEV